MTAAELEKLNAILVRHGLRPLKMPPRKTRAEGRGAVPSNSGKIVRNSGTIIGIR